MTNIEKILHLREEREGEKRIFKSITYHKCQLSLVATTGGILVFPLRFGGKAAANLHNIHRNAGPRY